MNSASMPARYSALIPSGAIRIGTDNVRSNTPEMRSRRLDARLLAVGDRFSATDPNGIFLGFNFQLVLVNPRQFDATADQIRTG
jgi:hypothetical protein